MFDSVVLFFDYIAISRFIEFKFLFAQQMVSVWSCIAWGRLNRKGLSSMILFSGKTVLPLRIIQQKQTEE